MRFHDAAGWRSVWEPVPSQPRRKSRRHLLIVIALPVIFLLLAAAFVHRLTRDLPDPVLLPSAELPLATLVYSADGVEIGRFYRENRRWVSFSEISPSIIDALVAAEDHRFFQHDGVDVVRLAGAGWRTLLGDVQGGSTITMHLARNLYPELGSEISPARKIREIVMARRIERRFSKEKIIEAYLNSVPFGFSTFGIEAAAQLYFGRSASDLNEVQAATLVGSLKGTTIYNPLRRPEAALARRNVVLGRMRDAGMLAEEETRRLAGRPLELDFQETILTGGTTPYFLAHVRRRLDEWSEASGYDVYRDGLKVHTTLDLRMQRVAEKAALRQAVILQDVAAREWGGSRFPDLWRRYPDLVNEHIRHTGRFERMVRAGADPLVAALQLKDDRSFIDSLRQAVATLQTGLVALDPKNGHVLAWIGGRDFAADQYDKVSQAMRQPGSTFKPFVYAAAIEAGLSPDYTLKDSAYVYPASGWRPVNFDGGYSGAEMTLRAALAQSKNTITAQLIDLVGTRRVVDIARRMGFQSDLRNVPSLALGTSEVTLLELASAYGPFTTGGYRTEPVVITHIEDRSGKVIARFAPQPRKVITRRTADAVLDMMRAVTGPGGTGGRIRSAFGLSGDLAGKTGTTQNAADGWFVLLHPELITGAWVGFNDQRITFRSTYWGQGAHNALNVAGDFARAAVDEGVAFQPAGFQAPARDPKIEAPHFRAEARHSHVDSRAVAASTLDSHAGTIRRLSW